MLFCLMLYRWAIQVLGEDDYCSNIRQLKNQKRMVAKHLDLLGYRVVQVSLVSLFSCDDIQGMEMSSH